MAFGCCCHWHRHRHRHRHWHWHWQRVFPSSTNKDSLPSGRIHQLRVSSPLAKPPIFATPYTFHNLTPLSTLNLSADRSIIILPITTRNSKMASTANSHENESPLDDLILKMSAKTTKCRLQLNTLKNAKPIPATPIILTAFTPSKVV